MNTPISNSFSAPVPPPGPSSGSFSPVVSILPGQQLFNDVTEFYSWYITCWYMSDSHSPPSAETTKKSDAIRIILSLIKRIAEVSMSSGKFLSELEERRAINELKNVVQDLNGGQLRKQNLPEALWKVLLSITDHNPKAKLVCQTTELEYRLCINPPDDQSPEMTMQYKTALAQIIQGITPQMRDINASAISQGLSQILDNNNLGSTDITKAIDEAVKYWL